MLVAGPCIGAWVFGLVTGVSISFIFYVFVKIIQIRKGEKKNEAADKN